MIARLDATARLQWLRLARADSVGPVAFRHLIDRFGSAGKVLEALPTLAARGGSARTPRIPSEAEAGAELQAGEALGGRLICAGEPDFPERLAALDPPPPVIWTRGRAEVLGQAAGKALAGG